MFLFQLVLRTYRQVYIDSSGLDRENMKYNSEHQKWKKLDHKKIDHIKTKQIGKISILR